MIHNLFDDVNKLLLILDIYYNKAIKTHQNKEKTRLNITYKAKSTNSKFDKHIKALKIGLFNPVLRAFW